MKKRILFIVNPISGVGRQKTVEKAVEQYLDKSKFDYEFQYTQRAKHATELSASAIGNFDIVVATGGDGTVNETAQPLIGSQTALAVIPTGSGNGFARHMKIPLGVSNAVKTINNLNISKIDTAKINQHKFVNVAGIGFDAHIAHEFAKFGSRGFFPYFVLIVKKFATYKARNYKIIADGKELNTRALMLNFANSSQFGFNAQIAPKAKVDDGLLNLTILKEFPLIAVTALATRLYSKSIHNSIYINTLEFKQLAIEFDSNTIEGHIDGEPYLFEGKIEISVVPESLMVVTNV